MATEHTKLIYVTTGVLLQKLVGSKTLTEYSHIFIDEVHNNLQFIDTAVRKFKWKSLMPTMAMKRLNINMKRKVNENNDMQT